MERYEYEQAARSFREVHERAPGWIAGSINLAIALLNSTGTDRAAGDAHASRYDEALSLLDGVLARDPAAHRGPRPGVGAASPRRRAPAHPILLR